MAQAYKGIWTGSVDHVTSYFSLITDCLDKRNVVDINYVVVSESLEIMQAKLGKMGVTRTKFLY